MSKYIIRRPRLYLSTRYRCAPSQSQRRVISDSQSNPDEYQAKSTDFKRRIAQLQEYKTVTEWYPRLLNQRLPLKEYLHRYENIANGLTKDDERHIVAGIIQSIRTSGSKLAFVTVEDDQRTLQIVINNAKLTGDGINARPLKDFLKAARKGDSFSFAGHPHRTQRGQLSLLADEIPQLLSPSLHQIPERLDDAKTLSHHRYVHMLVHPSAIRTLHIRHKIERTIDDFLVSRDFIKVNTPILQSGAGGAVARPFETTATELPGKEIHLRIAPELWLKKLIVGGMSRVYEIGPVFRNEGVDATHNPEFSICEFYAAHATLEELMKMTEDLLLGIAQAVPFDRSDHNPTPPVYNAQTPFTRIEFLPALESAIGQSLPNLESPDASSQLTTLFEKKSISLPAKPSLPRLLDALSGHYLEPLCDQPTFITHHPAALSPLSKHFRCPQTDQLVSARAELFINHREIANMYEEQNSPFAQREAFIEQLEYRKVDGESDGRNEIDEAYLEALEWGLPPTGGWGCGIDRLVMLFADQSRLGDVLSFGGLRNVIGTAHEQRK